MTDHAQSPEEFVLPIRPCNDQVLILREPLPTKSPGGLIDMLPESLLDGKTLVGAAVLAVGPKVLSVRPGERVHLRPTVGQELISPNGIVFHLVREETLWCVDEAKAKTK